MPDQILDSTINPTVNSEHADRSDISAPSVTLSGRNNIYGLY